MNSLDKKQNARIKELEAMVDMLISKIKDFANFQRHVACGTSRIGPVSDETQACLMDVAANLDKLVSNTQAIYEQKSNVRGGT